MHTYIHKNFIKMMTKRIKLTVNIYVDVFVSCLAMTVALCGWADLIPHGLITYTSSSISSSCVASTTRGA